MDKNDIENCEKMLGMFNDMYFKELKGVDLVEKMVIFRNFSVTVNKFKNPPKLELKKKKPMRTKKVESKGK